MRALISASAVAAQLAAAGCGGLAARGNPTVGAAAAVVPSDAVAFVAIDTDTSSGAVAGPERAAREVPEPRHAAPAAVRAAHEPQLANDVEPAFGDELDLAVLPGSTPELVGLTQPADPSKLAALVAKAGHGLVTRTVGGWTAIADSTAALDALTNATGTLAQNDTYVEATSALAGDALVRAYANGPEAQQLLESLRGATPSTPAKVQWASADVVAESGGLKLQALREDSPPAPPSAAYAAARGPDPVAALSSPPTSRRAATPRRCRPRRSCPRSSRRCSRSCGRPSAGRPPSTSPAACRRP